MNQPSESCALALSPAPPTLRDARALVAADAALSANRRRTLGSTFTKLEELAAPQHTEDTLRLDPRVVLQLLDRPSPALSRVGPGTLANYRAALRAFLRGLGFLEFARVQSSLCVMDKPWSALLASLPADREFYRLRPFAAFCAAEGIAPEAVGEETVVAYAARRAAERGGARARDQGRRVAALWNTAGRMVPGWPATRLGTLPGGREVSLPFEAYPQRLQDQVQLFLHSLTHAPDKSGRRRLFAREGTASRLYKPRSDRTVLTRSQCLRRLLHGAVQGGIPIEELDTLAVVGTMPFIETALEWHFARKGGVLTADMNVFSATILVVCQYLGIEEKPLREIKQRLALTKPEARREITPRLRLILDALKDKQTRAALLHLPRLLLNEAQRLRDGWTDGQDRHHPPRISEGAWLAQTAVAIEILLNAPVRMKNLHEMRLGHELRLTQTSRTRWVGLILVDETQAKNRRGVEFPLAPDTIALLRRYCEGFRSLLPNRDTNWLFPGNAGPDKPRSPSSLGDAIANTIHQYVGIRMHPHAFRAFAGAMILERDPHAIDDVRAVLGHSGFQTAMTFYLAISSRAAAERLSAELGRQRRETAPFVPTLPLGRGGRPWRAK